jgi:hypothetical protein
VRIEMYQIKIQYGVTKYNFLNFFIQLKIDSHSHKTVFLPFLLVASSERVEWTIIVFLFFPGSFH